VLSAPIEVAVVARRSGGYVLAIDGRVIPEMRLEVAFGMVCTVCASEARAFRPRDVLAPPLCGECVTDLVRVAWVVAVSEGRVRRN
jgi:hypothetical protein